MSFRMKHSPPRWTPPPKKTGKALRSSPCRIHCYLFLLFRLFGILWVRIRRLLVCRYRCDSRCICTARGQFRRLVLRCADVSVHEVLLHTVHHHLHRLGIIFRVNPDRLVHILFPFAVFFFIHCSFTGVVPFFLFLLPPSPPQ